MLINRRDAHAQVDLRFCSLRMTKKCFSATAALQNLVWYANNCFSYKSTVLASALDSVSDCRSMGREFEPKPCHKILVGIDHEIISTASLPLPLTQERQLSITGESMCT